MPLIHLLKPSETILDKFGLSPKGIRLNLHKRGVLPHGGGRVDVFIPKPNQCGLLKPVTWLDRGTVTGITVHPFSTESATWAMHSMIMGARAIFTELLPGVCTKPCPERDAKSLGYGVSLIAATTTGCFISADTAIACSEMEIDNTELTPQEQAGKELASQLLNEIDQGGVVNSTHRGLLFLLCALCPPDVSQVRVGKLSPYGMKVLGHIKKFLGVEFIITPDPLTGTVILKCVGSGINIR